MQTAKLENMKSAMKPDYLFEVSWEVCNKVGGIHTVIATKAITLLNELQNNYIVIGPDIVHDETGNPEFIEDHQLYAEWRQHAAKEDLRVRVGRWNIVGHPIAVLIDFSPMFTKKDKVFAEFWETYKLDSLSGQWDYIEPTLFGYTAGMVIENFILFNLSSSDKVVAQFHEWMTGSGVLYLKKRIPQVANVFTTHATVLGRCLAGNNRQLYKNLNNYENDEIAKEFNIISKQSIEKLSAVNADVFTTVSEITARECTKFLGRDVDIITSNGFEDNFVPQGERFPEIRAAARKKMAEVASTLLGKKVGDDTFYIATSGRYEFKNKGIDLFIDALGELNKTATFNRDVVAYILIPAGHYGPRKDLFAKLNGESEILSGSRHLTHDLHDPDWDPILNRLKMAGLKNDSAGKVKVIFVPSYLNGKDGIFNMPYYDVLIGIDLTLFTSYYEPWGYTPLESLAFFVPTVTTSLAGFGKWAQKECLKDCQGIVVVERDDDNDAEVISGIKEAVNMFEAMSPEKMEAARQSAFAISRTALWKTLIGNYKEAYSKALMIASGRVDHFIRIEEKQSEKIHDEILDHTSKPHWHRVIVKSKLPQKLAQLEELSQNLWWSWDDEAQRLFETIDPILWKESEGNPFILFEQVNYDRFKELSKDTSYVESLQQLYNRFKAYLAAKVDKKPSIAYFSMEYGLHSSLKIYSGGLGILAGDYLKEASDTNTNITAIGLLYRYGYFLQMLTTKGEQQAIYEYQHFSKLPIKPVRKDDQEFVTINIMLPGRLLQARVWEAAVGRIKLYLLDTDFDANIPEDRSITHHLYGGNWENRLKQEILLGIGGTRLLEAVGVKPDLYHSNEGHSAFVGLERMRRLIERKKLSFAEAKEIVRASTLFTTHTPVPAGHDEFEEDMLRKYIGHYPNRLKITWDELMALGRSAPNNWGEKFNMSHLAAHMAQEVNGVSMLHCAVTRDMFVKLWPGFLADELHVGYVTNGVHYPTWTCETWKNLYKKYVGDGFETNILQTEEWKKINKAGDAEIWHTKETARSRLIEFVKERFKENWIKRHEDPKQIMAINNQLSAKALTIVFARRFATYKRAYLLFRNPERLARLLNIPDKPVQFIFAGKAHPHDKAGQDMIKMIFEISKRPEFLGKIIFMPNYDMNLAKYLVSGADIWLNTPTRPLEASGTSGEKAVMNGTIHFSVLDGWWVEGYQPDAGWALTNKKSYQDDGYQDDLDAEIIYTILEQEIIPMFYNRNTEDVPSEWVSVMKNSIVKVASRFTTTRMIDDYINRFYSKLQQRTIEITNNDFEKAKEIASWKKRVIRSWKNIQVLEHSIFNEGLEEFQMGKCYSGQVVLDLNELSPQHIGVELVITENGEKLVSCHEFELEKYEVDRAYYQLNVTLSQPGTFNYGIRIFPKHEFLPHRQDFPVLRWI